MEAANRHLSKKSILDAAQAPIYMGYKGDEKL